MRTDISLTPTRIHPSTELPPDLVGCVGAVAEFVGLVRGSEDGQAIAALEYEAYSPMAERVMQQILDSVTRDHPCQFVRVTHRIGRVPKGEAAIHVVAAAVHRKEAFALLSEFMDRLKQDVPIWKCRAVPPENPPPPPAA